MVEGLLVVVDGAGVVARLAVGEGDAVQGVGGAGPVARLAVQLQRPAAVQQRVVAAAEVREDPADRVLRVRDRRRSRRTSGAAGAPRRRARAPRRSGPAWPAAAPSPCCACPTPGRSPSSVNSSSARRRCRSAAAVVAEPVVRVAEVVVHVGERVGSPSRSAATRAVRCTASTSCIRPRRFSFGAQYQASFQQCSSSPCATASSRTSAQHPLLGGEPGERRVVGLAIGPAAPSLAGRPELLDGDARLRRRQPQPARGPGKSRATAACAVRR